MKVKAICAWLFLTASFGQPVSSAQQSATKNVPLGPDFVIDTAKPYVYLEVDHVGPRKPLRPGEPNSGIWLHLKNNCKLPIVVIALGNRAQKFQEGITLQDQILPTLGANGTGGDSVGTALYVPPGLEQMKDIFRWPDLTEDEVKSAEGTEKSSQNLKRPLGYNSRNGFDTMTIMAVPSGGGLLFSVPLNHVSKDWHIEIPFRLAIPSNSPIRPPYSYLAFYQEDLDRAQGKAPMPTTR